MRLVIVKKFWHQARVRKLARFEGRVSANEVNDKLVWKEPRRYRDKVPFFMKREEALRLIDFLSNRAFEWRTLADARTVNTASNEQLYNCSGGGGVDRG